MRKASLLILVAALLISCRGSQSSSVYIVSDPYDGIDWNSVLQLKSSLHVHTVNSTIEHGLEEGTTVTPAEQIAKYEELGYDVLAITDHDYITYPWSEYGATESSMVAIKGNELSKNDNFCAYFCDWLDLPGEGPEKTVGFEESLRQASESGAVLYLAHPMRSRIRTSLQMCFKCIRKFMVLKYLMWVNSSVIIPLNCGISCLGN